MFFFRVLVIFSFSFFFPLKNFSENENLLKVSDYFEPDHKLSYVDLDFLLKYTKDYLKENIENLKVSKNISGFVRVNIPPPEMWIGQIKELRFNFWLPDVSIVSESTHSHPNYFESIVLSGGYAHEIFTKKNNEESQGEIAKQFRIFKNKSGNVSYQVLGDVCLKSSGPRIVTRGSIVSFPRSFIHRILAAEPNTLSFNVVFQEDLDPLYFDVFKSENFAEEDLKLEKEYLSKEDSKGKILEILGILNQKIGFHG